VLLRSPHAAPATLLALRKLFSAPPGFFSSLLLLRARTNQWLRRSSQPSRPHARDPGASRGPELEQARVALSRSAGHCPIEMEEVVFSAMMGFPGFSGVLRVHWNCPVSHG
jgi:hypothetical protein